MTIEELEEILRRNKVDFSTWGQHGTKPVSALLAELNNSEASLMERDGRVIRIITTAAINIIHLYASRPHVLKEVRQVFTDGTEKRREIDTSIGEKIRLNESYVPAVCRAITEELGIPPEGVGGITRRKVVIKENEPSDSYPGIFTTNTLHYSDVILKDEYVKLNGYIEIQPNKTTYFEWVNP